MCTALGLQLAPSCPCEGTQTPGALVPTLSSRKCAQLRGRGCPESLDRLGTRKEEGGAKTEQTQGGQVGGRQAVAGESSAVDRRWACTAVRGQGCSCFRKDCESLGVEEARRGTEKAGDGAEDVQGL